MQIPFISVASSALRFVIMSHFFPLLVFKGKWRFKFNSSFFFVIIYITSLRLGSRLYFSIQKHNLLNALDFLRRLTFKFLFNISFLSSLHCQLPTNLCWLTFLWRTFFLVFSSWQGLDFCDETNFFYLYSFFPIVFI